MDKELLSDMFYAAPELWYGIGMIFLLLIVVLIAFAFWVLKLKQKFYFLRRDRERYAETLYASHDGYFAFIYPDEKVDDPRKEITERCSRRLAIILGLTQGIKADFNDVLANFYKDDARKISQYVGLLKEEGTAFEDCFPLKNNSKFIRINGVRICGADGNIYCDMIWFRDISITTNRIKNLENIASESEQKFLQQQDLLDHLPFPIWLRNDSLDIIYHNKKFAELLSAKSTEAPTEIYGTNGESISKKLAERAHISKKLKHQKTGVVVNGNRVAMEVFESPFYVEQNFDKIFSTGCLIDISELDELQRNLKNYQEAQLEILGSLGTAFAVFDQNMSLNFYNKAFASLWKLDKSFLEEHPSYSAFLDCLREKGLLPETPDYRAFKQEELQQFGKLLEPQSDLLHLPNEKTLRRMRAPYPMGGVVFAYEDISDRLAATTSYNLLFSVQNEILSHLFNAVLVFGSNGRLTFFNDAYIKLWNGKKEFLSSNPSFDEVLESQRTFFNQKDWNILKKDIGSNILNITSKIITLQRNDSVILNLSVATLPDGSFMVCYQKEVS